MVENFYQVTDEDKLDRSQLVVVSTVVPESEAETAGILVVSQYL